MSFYPQDSCGVLVAMGRPNKKAIKGGQLRNSFTKYKHNENQTE